jgi:DNA replication protein DnaC
MTSLVDVSICSRCAGSGWVTRGTDSFDVQPCNCQGQLRRRQRIENARIPRRYLSHCELSTFHDKGSGVLVAAKRKVQEFVDEWTGRSGQRGLLLMGPCGAGKTHLAVGALLELINSGKSGRFLFSNFQDLIQEIQATFDNDTAVSKSELLRPLIEADLLVLDELGSVKPTTFVQDILYYVINSRYNEERTTIFTTNYFDDATTEGQRLQERIGERLRSRLYEMTDVINMKGAADHRSQNKQSRNML